MNLARNCLITADTYSTLLRHQTVSKLHCVMAGCCRDPHAPGRSEVVAEQTDNPGRLASCHTSSALRHCSARGFGMCMTMCATHLPLKHHPVRSQQGYMQISARCAESHQPSQAHVQAPADMLLEYRQMGGSSRLKLEWKAQSATVSSRMPFRHSLTCMKRVMRGR